MLALKLCTGIKLYYRNSNMQVQVKALCFTADSRHLISLGGQDDGKLVVWSIEKRYKYREEIKTCHQWFEIISVSFLGALNWSVAICGAFAKKEVTGPALSICPLRRTSHAFMTCGERKPETSATNRSGWTEIWNVFVFYSIVLHRASSAVANRFINQKDAGAWHKLG